MRDLQSIEAASNRHRRTNRHPGFELSPDMLEPSSMMQGLLPDMIRSRRHRRADMTDMLPFGGGDALSTMGHFGSPFRSSFFGGEDPFDSMVQSFMGGTNMMSSSMIQNGQNSNGFYQSSVTMMSSYVDENGERKVERYKKAACGDYGKDMHEVKEAYSNSETNKDTMAMERRHRDRGLQMIRERDNNTQVIDETATPINMDENEVEQFNNYWQNEFKPVYSRASLRGMHPNEDRRIPPGYQQRQLM